jgi:hypothetical protein
MPVNTVPERLTAFRVYLEGSTDLKGVADIQLPSLEAMTETVRGAGIAGEYESPTLGHFGSMKLTLNWRTVSKDMLKLLRQRAQRLDCRGAFQEYDAGAGSYLIRQTRVVVQGLPTKGDPGKFETGAPSDGSSELEVIYLKIDIDGRNVVEIDKLNYKCVIDGVDYLVDVRRALGL